MSTVIWLLAKIAIFIGLLWAGLMVLAAFGIDLLLRGSINTGNLGMGLFWSGFAAVALGLLVNPYPWLVRRAARDPNAELVIATPFFLLGGMTLGLLLIASSCGYVLTSGPADGTERGLAIAGLLVCAAALPGLWVARRAGVLRLSPSGLDYSGLTCGPISWRDITAAEVDYAWRSWFLTLRLRNEEEYVRRGLKSTGLRRWFRRSVLSPLSIPVLMLNVSPGWLRRTIQLRIDHFATSTPSPPPTVQRQGTSA